MLSLALRGLRHRWSSFAGTFLALALGVGLTAAMCLGLASVFEAPKAARTRDAEAVTMLVSVLGTATGVVAFTCVFMVSATFSFAVAQRRQEFGLLRSAGATPGQIRRAVLGEAVGIGVLAAAVGCVLGRYGAPLLAEWMVEQRLAPGWFVIGGAGWPYHAAFWLGVVVALGGAVAASARAGRVGAAEALREADVDGRVMTAGRWVLGGVLLVGWAWLMGSALVNDPAELLKRKTYTMQPMLLIGAVAMFAPLLVRPVARVVAWLPSRVPGAVGMLAREQAAAGVRRTAAVAAPVLVTVALAGSLLGAPELKAAAQAAEVGRQTVAGVVVDRAGGGGRLPGGVLGAVREVPGVRAATVVRVGELTYREERTVRVPSSVRAAEPQDLARTTRLPIVSGSLAKLDDGGIVVNEEWTTRRVGQRVEVWIGGRHRWLRIVAVMRVGTGDNGAVVTPANLPVGGGTSERVEVVGGSVRAVAEAVQRFDGVRAAPAVRQASDEQERLKRLGVVVVLGLALLYTLLGLANTLVMAAATRRREVESLRLGGATRRQVLVVAGLEAVIAVAVGTVLGVVAVAASLGGVWVALGSLVGWSVAPVVVPVGAVGVMAGVCAGVAVPVALGASVRLLRVGS